MKTILLLLFFSLPLMAQTWDAKTGRGTGGGANYPATTGPVCNTSTTAAGTCKYQDLQDVNSADPRGTRIDGHDPQSGTAAPAAPATNTVTLTKCSGSVHWCTNENNAGTISSFPLIDASIAAERARILSQPNCTINSDFANAIRDGRCPVPPGQAVQLVGTVAFGHTDSSGITSQPVTATVAIPGDVIYATYQWQNNANAPSSVVDSNGVTGTLVKGPQSDTATTPTYTAVYQFPNTPAGSDTFTATWASAVNFPSVSTYEFQGAPATNPTEGAISSGLTYSSGSFTCGSPGSITTSQTNETIFTLVDMQYYTVTATGYTQITGGNFGQVYYSAISSASTVTPSYTASQPGGVSCIAFAIKRN